jgi:hypothetical protein
MKKNVILDVVIAFLVVLLFGCASTGNSVSKNNSEIKISVNLDQSIISNQGSLAPWMAYAIIIASEMERYYKNNPNGEFIVSYENELLAREAMIEYYLELKNKRELSENYQYLEEMIMIKNAGYLKEYVFFSFNPGAWVNTDNLIERNYLNWRNNNIPRHRPLTLAYITKE